MVIDEQLTRKEAGYHFVFGLDLSEGCVWDSVVAAFDLSDKEKERRSGYVWLQGVIRLG